MKIFNNLGIQKLSSLNETVTTCYRLVKLVWETDKWLLVGNMIAVIVPAITPFVIAYVFKLVVDMVVAGVSGFPIDFTRLYIYVGAVIFMSYLNQMSFTVQRYATRILYTKLPLYLYQIVLGKLTSLDVHYFEDSKFRDTLQKVRESYVYRPLEMLYNLLFLFQSLLQVIIALIAIIRLSPYLALALLVTALPDLYNQLYFSKISWGIWSHHTPHRKKFSYLSELLQSGNGIKELKIFQTAQ